MMYALVSQYTKDISTIDELALSHVAWLEELVKDGVVLVAGRLDPRTGGMIVVNAESKDVVESTLEDDPFVRAEAAEYRVIPFFATVCAPCVEDWLRG